MTQIGLSVRSDSSLSSGTRAGGEDGERHHLRENQRSIGGVLEQGRAAGNQRFLVIDHCAVTSQGLRVEPYSGIAAFSTRCAAAPGCGIGTSKTSANIGGDDRRTARCRHDGDPGGLRPARLGKEQRGLE